MTPRLDLTRGVELLEQRWGADPAGRFPCPIPGHAGRSSIGIPPAGEDPRGEPRLLCCTGRWRSLGEVTAGRAYGVDQLRSPIEIATWTRRLAREIGIFEPLAVLLPELPPDATPATATARDGFRLLVGLRWADGPRHGVAYSIRFVAAWCGLGFRPARLAIDELKRAGVIAVAGAAGNGNRTPLYVPGCGR